MTKIHKAKFRVYYEDTDAVGIMYHANFIAFCERGRSEMLREVGYPASEVHEKLNAGFVVRHIDCDFLKMVKLDDLLEVQTVLKSMKNTSFIMEQTILKKDVNSHEGQNSVVFKMDITLVCMDLGGKPTRVPDKLREAFQEYLVKG